MRMRGRWRCEDPKVLRRSRRWDTASGDRGAGHCNTTPVCQLASEHDSGLARTRQAEEGPEIHLLSGLHLRMHFLNGEIHIWIVFLLVWIENETFLLLGAEGDNAMANSWICQTLRSIVSDLSSPLQTGMWFLAMKRCFRSESGASVQRLTGKGSMWKMKWWREVGTLSSSRSLFKDKTGSREYHACSTFNFPSMSEYRW